MTHAQRIFSLTLMASLVGILWGGLTMPPLMAQSEISQDAIRNAIEESPDSAIGSSNTISRSNDLTNYRTNRTLVTLMRLAGSKETTNVALCPELISDGRSETYIVTPSNGVFYIDYPYYHYDLQITPCQASEDLSIILIDPQGNIIQPIAPKTNAFKLSQTAPNGEYEILIRTRNSEFRKTIIGTRSTRNSTDSSMNAGKLVIYDATFTDQIVATANENQPLLFEYSNWPKHTVLEVGVYGHRDYIGPQGFVLINSWQIAMSGDGSNSEKVIIPANTDPGIYYFVACNQGSCLPAVKSGGWDYSDFVESPRVAWQGITIGGDEQRRVDQIQSDEEAQSEEAQSEEAQSEEVQGEEAQPEEEATVTRTPTLSRPSEIEHSTTTPLFDFQDSTTPTTRYYAVEVEQEEARSLTFAWCAVSRTLLPQIMEPLENVTMSYDGNQVIPAASILEYEKRLSAQSNWFCHYWTTIISNWPPRPIIFKLEYEIVEQFNDGVQDYFPGKYTHIIEVMVNN